MRRYTFHRNECVMKLCVSPLPSPVPFGMDNGFIDTHPRTAGLWEHIHTPLCVSGDVCAPLPRSFYSNILRTQHILRFDPLYFCQWLFNDGITFHQQIHRICCNPFSTGGYLCYSQIAPQEPFTFIFVCAMWAVFYLVVNWPRKETTEISEYKSFRI